MDIVEQNLRLLHRMQMQGIFPNPHLQYYDGDNTLIEMHSTKNYLFSFSKVDKKLSNVYLKDLYIVPSLRRTGIGTNIIKSLTEYCNKFKVKAIETESENNSLGFFIKLGFKQMKNEEKNRLILNL